MRRIIVSLGIATCLATSGFTGKLPQAAAQPSPARMDVVVEEVKPSAATWIPHSGLELNRVRTRTLASSQERIAHEDYLMRTTPEYTSSTVRPADDEVSQKISAVAKDDEQKRCPSSKHRHAAYLRSDIAYSTTGVDCQGDKPNNQ